MIEAGVRLEVLTDHFPPGTADVNWIPVVATRRWIALTHDARIRYNSPERNAIMDSGLRVIVIRSGSARADMATVFLDLRDQIYEFVRENPAPFIARLYRDRIEMWLSRGDWAP